MSDPLVHPEVDLRDFAYMPLDVLRLRDSDLAAEATDAEFRAAVMLWCAAWHQVPAASLPDNDAILTRLCGLGRDQSAWREIREGALRGWVKCSDGRLYHPVVAEKANEAWEQRQNYRDRLAKARLAKAEKNRENPPPTQEPITEAVIEPDIGLKGTERNGTERISYLEATPLVDDKPSTPPVRKKIDRTESDQELLDRITDRWNAWATSHGSPLVVRLTAKRGAHCRRRIGDLMQFGHETPEAAFDWLLSKVDQSFFARGSPRKPLDFDQLMRDEFMTKMVEGSFEFKHISSGNRKWAS